LGERSNRLHDSKKSLTREITVEGSPLKRLLQWQRRQLVGYVLDHKQPRRSPPNQHEAAQAAGITSSRSELSACPGYEEPFYRAARYTAK